MQHVNIRTADNYAERISFGVAHRSTLNLRPDQSKQKAAGQQSAVQAACIVTAEKGDVHLLPPGKIN
jgi:hypothetical protein